MRDYDVRVKTYEPRDPRLGRNVLHDSRSLQFLAPEAPSLDTLVSVRHISGIPILDQLNLGSCTGNAATAVLSYSLLWLTAGYTVLSATDAIVDEEYAVGVYSGATAIDPFSGTYPPDDTGSNGLSVAKVIKTRGLISGYLHATSLTAVLTALQKQAVIVGTEWRTDMFDPDPDGRIHITGNVEGGHEYVLDEIDVENRRVWIRNSWGSGWGINGRAWMTWEDFETLLLADGDCTVFVPLSEPAPAPSPSPAPTNVDDADRAFALAAYNWLNGFPFFYRKHQAALRLWLQKKGL